LHAGLTRLSFLYFLIVVRFAAAGATGY